MASPIEAGKNYLLSVADRAVAFTYWKAVYKQGIRNEEVPPINKADEPFWSAWGATCPTGIGIIKRRFYSENSRARAFLQVAAVPALLLDFAVMAYCADAAFPDLHLATLFRPYMEEGRNPLAAIIHNPVEAIAAKIVINAATHVVLDLAEAAGKGIKRLRNFRPSSTALAV